MDRFRFGLGGLGGPLTERELYGTAPPEERLALYGGRFDAYEMNVSRLPEFTDRQADAVLDRMPSNVHIIPRLDRRVTDASWDTPEGRAALDTWLHNVQPVLRSSRRGPLFIPWTGARTPRSEEALEDLLSTLWPLLPGRQRIAVEFRDPSWFRPGPIQMLEEHGAALVWSTLAGTVPYRLTADFIYVRLTGPSRRVTDEVEALAARILARPHDDRTVYVVSARHHEPYGLHTLERFAEAVGQPLRRQSRTHAPAPMQAVPLASQQRSLDGYPIRA